MSATITDNIKVLGEYIDQTTISTTVMNIAAGRLIRGHADDAETVQHITVFFSENGDQTRHELKIACSPDASQEMLTQIEKAATIALVSMPDIKPFVAHSMKNSQVAPVATPSFFTKVFQGVFGKKISSDSTTASRFASMAKVSFDQPDYEDDKSLTVSSDDGFVIVLKEDSGIEE